MAETDQVLEKAAQVFGAVDDAKCWLDEPALGLGYKRPIDVMKTKAGTDIVLKLLEQIDNGVYV